MWCGSAGSDAVGRWRQSRGLLPCGCGPVEAGVAAGGAELGLERFRVMATSVVAVLDDAAIESDPAHHVQGAVNRGDPLFGAARFLPLEDGNDPLWNR